jgi:DNA helicase HerA-like ATPase
MRATPKVETAKAIPKLGTGEAQVPYLDTKGPPSVTERVWMTAPGSKIGPISDAERTALKEGSNVAGVYEKTVDRESAFELLQARAGEGAAAPVPAGPAETKGAGAEGKSVWDGISDVLFGSTGPRGGKREGVVDAMAKSAARSIGSSLGRGLLGSLLGKKR